MKSDLTIHVEEGLQSVAIIYRFGCADQTKKHEFMPDDNGTWYDNCGYNPNNFTSSSAVISAFLNKYPDIELRIFK